jgi:flagellar protein FliO/FliZ
MLRIIQHFFIGLLLLFSLLGFQTETYAEQLNSSVKDCLEQPDACEEQPKDSSQTETKDNEDVEDKGSETASSSIGLTLWDFVKMIFATVFVVALLYFVLKFVNAKGRLFKSTQLIENLGGTTLGANRSVQLIKIGNQLLIVGVGENIQLLKEIDDEQEYEQIILEYNNQINQMGSPNDIITKVLKRVKGKENRKDEEKPPFQTLLKKQLDDLSKGRKQLYENLEKKKGPDKS